MKRISIFAAILFTITLSAQKNEIKEHFKEIATSDLLMLGTFHFKDAGLDGYKPKYSKDILSEKGQKELNQLLDILKKYGPTKIGIEVKANRQHKLDSLYNLYLEGKYDISKKANEIFQVGFKLAKLLGHKKIYAIDAPGVGVKNNITSKKQYDSISNFHLKNAPVELMLREQKINTLYKKWYEKGDKLKTEISLVDFFRVMNHPDVITNGHGHYVMGNFKLGNPQKGDYFGADSAMWWYSRNVRIFQNILRMHEPGKDKIMVLIGAGHLPIINFLAKSSKDFDFKTFEEVAGK